MPALIVDPALVAAVTRQFNLRGELQPFNLTENVVPVFDIGTLLGLDPTVVTTPNLVLMVAAGHSAAANHYAAAPPDSAGLNVASEDVNPASGAVLADTGQLAAGLHYCQMSLSTDEATIRHYVLQHRDAANAASIAVWNFWIEDLNGVRPWSFSVTFALNERLRWTVGGANIVGEAFSNVSAAPSALDVAT